MADPQEMVIEDISEANKEYKTLWEKQSANLMNKACTAVYSVIIAV